MRVRASGKIELVIGKHVFDVSEGAPCSFLQVPWQAWLTVQQAAVVDAAGKHPRIVVLGDVQRHVIVTPNMDEVPLVPTAHASCFGRTTNRGSDKFILRINYDSINTNVKYEH